MNNTQKLQNLYTEGDVEDEYYSEEPEEITYTEENIYDGRLL